MRRLGLVVVMAVAGCGNGGHDAHQGLARAVDERAAHGGTTADHTAHGGVPEGYAEVAIPSDRQQLIGLKTAAAVREKGGASVRATGIVRTDETREVHVHSRIMGWVQKLYVNAVGQTVEKGAPLYSIYSQEVWAAQQEYARARKLSPDLAAAARARLTQWDVPQDEIRRIEREGPSKNVIIRSPTHGTVVELDVKQGHYLEPDMMLYRIADLSQVWVLAEVYEYEAQRIDKTGEATVQVQGVVEPIRARIDYVYPTVDPASRTIKVRLVVPNPDGVLRPGAFATVDLPSREREGLWVPAEAVIDTGKRRIVYVALAEGRFRPVDVQVGGRADDKVEILHGLSEGDQVVVSAQFLLDSESRLRSSAAGGGGHTGGH